MLTDRQKELRRSHEGASDMAPIMGLSPFANRQSVWAAKVLDQDEPENEAMALGNLLEPAILTWCEEKLGVKLDRRNSFRVSKGRDNGIMACNLDSPIRDRPREAVEAKMSSDLDSWGDEGTDQVPDHVVIQTQAQMYVAELDVVHVPVMLICRPRPVLKLYRVERSQEIIDPMVSAGIEFWEQFVVPKVMPQEEAPNLEVLKRLPRQPGKIVEVDPRIVSGWETAREYRLGAEKAEQGMEALLLQALGDGDGARLPDGRLLTYTETKRKGYVVEEATYRSLKIKKGN